MKNKPFGERRIYLLIQKQGFLNNLIFKPYNLNMEINFCFLLKAMLRLVFPELCPFHISFVVHGTLMSMKYLALFHFDKRYDHPKASFLAHQTCQAIG